MSVEVPISPDGINDEWLTSVLREKKLIESDDAVTITNKKALVGGFTSSVSHYNLSYKSAGNHPIQSLVVKYAVAVGELGKVFGEFYEKELYVYNNAELREAMKSVSTFRTPTMYYAAKTESRYIYVMEDLTSAVNVAQTVGANLEQAKAVVRGQAEFHAKFWAEGEEASSKLREKWFPFSDAWIDMYEGVMKACVRGAFFEVYEDPIIRKVGLLCSNNFAGVLKESRKPPCTILHGDARCSNYFIDAAGKVIAGDWQIFLIGGGPVDLAYFLCTSVQREVRKAHEKELITLYLDTLIAHGVKTATYESIYRQYLLGLATVSSMAVNVARFILDGRKYAKEMPTDPQLAQAAWFAIGMATDVQPMIDGWCSAVVDNKLLEFLLELFPPADEASLSV